MKLRTAKIISTLLGPLAWFPIILFLTVLMYSRNQTEIFQVSVILATFQVIIPATIFQIAKIWKIIPSWDMVSREHRIPMLLLCLFSYILSLLCVYQLGNLHIFNLLLIEVVTTIILILITFIWKISLHAAVGAGGVIVVNSFFSWHLLILFLIVPIIIWARYTLNKHSLAELIWGVIVGGSTPLILLRLLKQI